MLSSGAGSWCTSICQKSSVKIFSGEAGAIGEGAKSGGAIWDDGDGGLSLSSVGMQ